MGYNLEAVILYIIWLLFAAYVLGYGIYVKEYKLIVAAVALIGSWFGNLLSKLELRTKRKERKRRIIIPDEYESRRRDLQNKD